MHRFTTSIIIVTGAGSGIGQATAMRLAREGARVVGFDMNPDGLAATAAQLGDAFLSVTVDLTQSQAVQAAVQQAVAWGQRLDGLFCAAGASGRRWGDGPTDQCSDQGWLRTLDVNLNSIFYVCRSVLPYMRTAGAGSIVNLGSVLGMVGGDDDFATHAYAAAKAGIIGLSRAMASYYAPHGIRVNVVAPGLIATPMSQRAQTNPHILARLASLQPLTGSMGQPDDIAAAVAYLLSDDARFVTGTVLPVDGGWTTR